MRDLGEAAKVFLKRLPDASCERYGFADKNTPFTPKEYFDTLASMENGGKLWLGKFSSGFGELIEVLRLLDQFADGINKRREAAE